MVYREAAADDLVRQFRYYLVDLDLPEIATRFREAIEQTVRSLSDHPLIGPHIQSNEPRLRELRSWPVVGFEAIRIYYLWTEDTLQVVRILHGKRDVARILS